MLLMMLLTATTAWSNNITLQRAVVINSGNKATYHNNTLRGTVAANDAEGNSGNFISKGAIVVDGIELNLTIDGLHVDYSGQYYATLSGISLVNGAKLHLTVNGVNTLTASYGGAGIAVPFGCSLEITAASTGTLNVTGGDNYGGGAGIGSRGSFNGLCPQGCGDITINGGTINARGGSVYHHYNAVSGAAGIGSSEGSGGETNLMTYSDNTFDRTITGNIIINGGTVRATGSVGAAGIGGGDGGTVKTITITGGYILATAGNSGAAIGSGWNGQETLTCADISIIGGWVEANGNIGYGEGNDEGNHVGGSVTISDEATVSCTGVISPSVYRVAKRTFHITVYYPTLTSTRYNVKVYLPLGKTAYCDLQVEKPGIGTATVDVLYPESQLGSSGNVTISGLASKTLWLSKSSQDVVLGGYYYTFSGSIYDKDIVLGTTATFTLDDISDISDIYVNSAYYNPEKAGSGTTAGVAYFSGYFITRSILSGKQTFRVTDSNNKDYTKTVTFPESDADHKIHKDLLISDGNLPDGVTYIDANHGKQICEAFQIPNGTSWGATGNTSWFVVNSDITISERITVNGTVNLILCDGASLNATKGITVLQGNSLNIYGQHNGSGWLYADARPMNGGNHTYQYAGIGGYAIDIYNNWEYKDYGTISIYGGNVVSQGGDYAAGIGGGGSSYGEKIRICGGWVLATGGDGGAGIGGGHFDMQIMPNRGTIEISGGFVQATGMNGGAGIGGGYYCDGGTITISGGQVWAEGTGWDTEGAGIGCGEGAGGGTISLDWTDLTDHIYATSYDGNVTFKKDFMLQDTDIKAVTSNIHNKTIVPSRTISFVANGGSGTMSNSPIAVGASYRLPECAFTVPDESKVFYRWQINGGEYMPGETITVGDDLVVKALWREGNKSVTFNMNGHGEDIAKQSVPYASQASAPAAPTADGYEFAGWYLGETPYNFNTPVTADIELTAHWSTVVSAPLLTVTGSYTYTGGQIVPTLTVKDGETVVPASEYTMTTTNTTKAGTATVTITDKAGGNYKLATASAEFTVLPKSVTVSGITAKDKHYDRNTSVEIDGSHAVFSGIVGGDVLTVAATGAFVSTDYGEGKTVNISGLTLGGRDCSNYVLAAEGQQTTTTATIYAPHTVTFADEVGTALDGFAVETILNGETAMEPTVTDANHPVKNGYRFMGWNYNGEAFDFDTPFDFETTTTLTLTPRFLKLHSILGAAYAGAGTGTVAFDKTEAVVGEEVTVTASPNEGSELAYLDIYYRENNKVTVIPYAMTGENEAMFTMPDKDEIHVSGAFSLSDDLLAGLKNVTTGNYEVTKAADLVLLCTWMKAGKGMEGETILLMNDIDVSGSGFTSFPYTIQGGSSQYVFKGIFDGGGHTISGISISTGGEAGLFMALGGTVKNLTVTGSVKGSGKDNSVGGIACTVAEGGTIQNCVSLVKVTSGNTDYTGGIAGLSYGTVSGCHYLGNGVPGAVGSYSYNVAATSCTALYAVEGSDNESIGIATVGTMTSDRTIYGDRYHEAGSQVTMALTAGGKDGWTLSGFKYQNNSNDDVNLTANGNGTYTLTVPSEDVAILPNYRYSALTMQQDAQNRYLVTSVADLNEVAALASVLDGCQGMTFLLANDIEFGENDSFGGIAVDGDYDHSFAGTFDGGGHTISGMNISGRAQNLGFIGYLTGTLQNLTLAYCTVNNTSDAEDTYAGMLVGDNNYGNMYGNRVIDGTVSGAKAGAIGGNWSPMDASNNLYNDEVTVVSGGVTKTPGECGTSGGDRSYNGSNAAVVGWRVIFLDESGQMAPAQLVANGDAAIKPIVNPAPRTHFTFNGKWKRGGSSTEYTFDPVKESDGITANTTLYPIWNEEAKYTVSYNGNGGSGNDVTQQVYASEVGAFRLPACFYTAPVGCYFSAWRIGDTDYAPGASIDFSATSPSGEQGGLLAVTAQWERYAFELADNADNSTVLNTWKDKAAYVTLQGRTLYKDGDWNTLCLPFSIVDINAKDEGGNYTCPLHGATVKTLVSSSFSGGTLSMNFTEDKDNLTAIVAGKPYIVKWTKPDGYDGHENEFDISNPVFTGVTISSSNAGRIATDYVDFVGTYSPTDIFTTDKTNLYLGGGNTLYYPWGEGMTKFELNACRGYFHLKNGLMAGAPSLSRFVLNFGDGSEISSLNDRGEMINDKEAGAWYDLSGRKLDNVGAGPVPARLRKGLYIHNGRKVVVK